MTLVDDFKEAFRFHPAGIALITANTDEGPVGLTASSVASVSLDPVAIMFSVTRATGSAGGILHADSFLVHLIDSMHEATAKEFAVSGGERFTEAQGWQTLETGEPYLKGARAALRCTPKHVIGVGSSSVVIAEVQGVIMRGDIESGSAPLIYHDRTFYNL